MITEFVLTGRDHAGNIVASESTDASKTADRVSRSWQEAGLAVEVEERAVVFGLPCPVI